MPRVRPIHQILAIMVAVFAIIGSTYAFVESARTDIRLLDNRVDSIDNQLARVDTRLTGVEGRLVAVEESLSGLRMEVASLDRQLGVLEGEWATAGFTTDQSEDVASVPYPEDGMVEIRAEVVTEEPPDDGAWVVIPLPTPEDPENTPINPPERTEP